MFSAKSAQLTYKGQTQNICHAEWGALWAVSSLAAVYSSSVSCFQFQLGRSWSCPAGHISLKMAVSACFLPCCVGQAPTGSMTIRQGQLAAGRKLHCVSHHYAIKTPPFLHVSQCTIKGGGLIVWWLPPCWIFLPLCGLFAMQVRKIGPLNAWLWPPFWVFYFLCRHSWTWQIQLLYDSERVNYV